MGATIKADQKRQATKINKERQLLRSVLVHVVSALICALICSFSYWFPWLNCLINHFLWIYLPILWPVVTAPKYMFVVANAIVLVLVNEFRLTEAKSEHPRQDMYEEYVQRSRRHSRALVCRKAVRKVEMIEDARIPAEEKKDEMVTEASLNKFVVEKTEKICAEEIYVKTSTEEKKEETEVRSNFEEKIEKTNEYTGVNSFEEDQKMFEETEASNSEEILEETSLIINLEDDKDRKKIVEIEADTCSEENTSTHGDATAHNLNDSYDDQNSDAEQAEETRVDDELAQRVEDFISKVYKRRWIEVDNWLICSAESS